MSGSTIFLFYFSKRFDETQLLRVVALELGVPVEELGTLMEARARVPYEFFRYERGFPCRLDLYLGQSYSGPGELEFALRLAKRLATNVLISPDESEENPYLWWLVHPDGTVFEASEILSNDDEEDDGAVEIREELKPLKLG